MVDFVDEVFASDQEPPATAPKVLCEFCGKRFGKEYLRRHKQRKHPQRKDPKHPYMCPGCNLILNGSAKCRHFKKCHQYKQLQQQGEGPQPQVIKDIR